MHPAANRAKILAAAPVKWSMIDLVSCPLPPGMQN
jgi:hypothetical protein